MNELLLPTRTSNNVWGLNSDLETQPVVNHKGTFEEVHSVAGSEVQTKRYEETSGSEPDKNDEGPWEWMGGDGRYERGTRRAGSYLRERVLICTMGGRRVILVGRVRLLLLLVLQRVLIRNGGHLPLMHGLERWKDI